MTVIATTVDTPTGPLTLLTIDDVAHVAAFGDDPDALRDRLPAELRTVAMRRGESGAAEAVRAWADGDVDALDSIAVQQRGSAYFQDVWREMRRIPAGTTMSYAELAARAGMPRAVRAAASACARNNVCLVVPCHRVVRTDGTLGGYFYGLDVKRRLLAHESRSRDALDGALLPAAM